jgi:hypothetical protein
VIPLLLDRLKAKLTPEAFQLVSEAHQLVHAVALCRHASLLHYIPAGRFVFDEDRAPGRESGGPYVLAGVRRVTRTNTSSTTLLIPFSGFFFF